MRFYSLLLFVMTIYKNFIHDGTKFYCLCQRFRQVMSWKVSTNQGYVSLRNSKLYWNCTTWSSSKDIDAQLTKIEDDDEEKHRSETSITKF